MSDFASSQEYLSPSSPTYWTDSDLDTMMSSSVGSDSQGTSSISILSSSLKKSETETGMELDSGKFHILFFFFSLLEFIPSFYLEQSKKKLRSSRWHLGIRSPSRPEDIMNEVYRVLKFLSIDWKVHNYYHICCRDRIGDHDIKVNLQLYKADQRYYLLDFRNVTRENGELSVFDFIYVCNRIISELASNAQKEK
jgi:hypothetical protein